MISSAPLAVGGNRLLWSDVPVGVRSGIEAAVKSAVIGAETKDGGFSPGLASVLHLARGGSVFVKAASTARSEFTVHAIRSEAAVLARLPAEVPAPKLLDHFDFDDWTVLVTEVVDGHNPVQPWQPNELRRFLNAYTVLADILTPAPIAAPLVASEAPEFQRSDALAADPELAERLTEPVRRRLDQLAELEQGWTTVTTGDTLLHWDLRSDNLLLTRDGFVVVDWPHVRVGARWLDLLLGLPSIALHGGGDPDLLWSAHPLSEGVDPYALNVALAGATGFFLHRSLQPPIPLLPTIRQFQRAHADVLFAWLSQRLGWRS